MNKIKFLLIIIVINITIILMNSCFNTNQNYKTLTNHFIKQWDHLSSISFDDNYKVLFAMYLNKIYTIEGVDSNIIRINIIGKNNLDLIYKKLILEEDNFISYINIKAMTISDKYLLLLVSGDNSDYLYYFDLFTFDLIKKKKLDVNTYENVYLIDSLLYFAQSYNYHPKDAENQSLIDIRNIDNLKLVKMKILNIKGIELTHFGPYRNIDFLCSKGMVIYSDLNNFNIKLLDKDLNCLDSIEYIPDKWSTKYIDEIQFISDSSKKIAARNRMDYLRELLKNGLSKIYQIGFINDTTFYAAYYSGKKSDMEEHISHWDIFRISNCKIVKFKTGLTDIFNDDYTPIILSDHIPIFKDGKAYFFTFYDYNSIFNFLNMPDWIRHSLSLLTGTRIKMNMVELSFEGL
ncbi:MAG: hypothetical protein V1779_03355 [bacterium]